MTLHHRLLIAALPLVLLPGAAGAADNIPYSKAVQQACRDDYKRFCEQYGIESAALRLCMDKVGDSLSDDCVRALIQSGEVSQAEVDRRKKPGH